MVTKRLAEGKRVRTTMFGGNYLQPHGESEARLGINSHIFQDDVTIIGVTLAHEILVTDVALNADAQLEITSEVSRQGRMYLDGLLIHFEGQAMWTAGIAVFQNIRGQVSVMFPEGHGIEVDEGEGVNLHLGFNNGATVDLSAFALVTLYYVER